MKEIKSSTSLNVILRGRSVSNAQWIIITNTVKNKLKIFSMQTKALIQLKNDIYLIFVFTKIYLIFQTQCHKVSSHHEEQIIGMCQNAQCIENSRRCCLQCLQKLHQDDPNFNGQNIMTEDKLNDIYYKTSNTIFNCVKMKHDVKEFYMIRQVQLDQLESLIVQGKSIQFNYGYRYSK